MNENVSIEKTAVIGADVHFGAFVVIGENVAIGKECVIGNNVVIHEGTKIGDFVRIDDNTVIGKNPMRAKRSIFKNDKKYKPAVIGNDCMIGAQVVIYTGSVMANNILVADGAAIREDVSIGEYTIVGRGVTVENKTSIGKKCKLETGCYITAYSKVGDYCFIAPNVCTSNDNFLGRTEERFQHFKGVTVKTGGRIGANATILPGIVIGEDAVVGAGSVVTRDVKDFTIVVGAPAKYFKDTPEEQRLDRQGWE
ncbi:N-acetyltransferase [bacterium]|nr:N-acetyltransferase [bacterium]